MQINGILDRLINWAQQGGGFSQVSKIRENNVTVNIISNDTMIQSYHDHDIEVSHLKNISSKSKHHISSQ